MVMSYIQARNPMQQYAQISVQTGIEDASPHRLVQMLLEGAIDRIAKAKGFIANKKVAEKGLNISQAISIINGLRSALDMENGSEISQNLDALYEYMEGRLLSANVSDNIEQLNEISQLLLQIKAGWDGIADEAAQLNQKAAV